MSPGAAQPTFEHLLRELAPQVLGAIARRHGDFATAEDAVQEALIAAALQWPDAGLPANPHGWLYHVAMRRLTDHLRSEISRRRREDAVVSELWAEWAFVPPPDAEVGADRDDTLRLGLGGVFGTQLLADFGLGVGASSTAQMGMQEVTLTLAARHDALEVFGTRFQDVIEVRLNQSAGDRRTNYFARGVGLVGMERDRPRDRVRLISATVEGTPIGTAAP